MKLVHEEILGDHRRLYRTRREYIWHWISWVFFIRTLFLSHYANWWKRNLYNTSQYVSGYSKYVRLFFKDCFHLMKVYFLMNSNKTANSLHTYILPICFFLTLKASRGSLQLYSCAKFLTCFCWYQNFGTKIKTNASVCDSWVLMQ